MILDDQRTCQCVGGEAGVDDKVKGATARNQNPSRNTALGWSPGTLEMKGGASSNQTRTGMRVSKTEIRACGFATRSISDTPKDCANERQDQVEGMSRREFARSI